MNDLNVNKSNNQNEINNSTKGNAFQYPDDEQMIAACKDFLKTVRSMKGLERLSDELDKVGLGQEEIVIMKRNTEKSEEN